MEYTIAYTDAADRSVKVAGQEALGRVMLYDNFTPTGGILTFADVAPPTAKELAEKAETAALAQAEALIDAIGNLADAKAFLKRLVKRLLKKGLLP